MDNELKNIDKLFKDHLLEYPVEPPADAWNQIHSRLDKRNGRQVIFYVKWAAASVLILIAFGTGYYFALYQNQFNDNNQLSSVSQQKKPPTPLTDINRVENHQDNSGNIQIIPQPRQPSVPGSSTVNPGLHPDKTTQVPDAEAIEPVSSNIIDTELADAVETRTESNLATPGQDHLAISNHPQGPQAIPTQIPPDYTPKLNDELLRKILGTDDIRPDKDDITQNKVKWSVGGQLAPVYSYRMIEVVKVPEGTELNKEFYNSAENGITTVSTGLNINYAFNDNISLQTGFVFSKIGQSNSDVPIFNEPGSQYLMQLNTSAGRIIINPSKFESQIDIEPADPKDSTTGNYGVNSTLFQNFSYIELPLVMKYNLISQKVGLNVRGGLSPGFMVGNNSYFADEGSKLSSGITQNVNQVIYNGLLGFGIDIKLNKSLIFNIEPTFKYSLFSITSGEFIRMHPYSVSCFTGISYKF